MFWADLTNISANNQSLLSPLELRLSSLFTIPLSRPRQLGSFQERCNLPIQCVDVAVPFRSVPVLRLVRFASVLDLTPVSLSAFFPVYIALQLPPRFVVTTCRLIIKMRTPPFSSLPFRVLTFSDICDLFSACMLSTNTSLTAFKNIVLSLPCQFVVTKHYVSAGTCKLSNDEYGVSL